MKDLIYLRPVFIKHSQEHPLSFSPDFVNLNLTQLLYWLNHMVSANQNLCYIQMLQNIENSGEQDKECS